MPVGEFMRRYWQRRPLLVRGLFAPGEFAAIDRARLIGLAARDDVESRLVRRRRGRWSVAHGPFSGEDFPSATTRGWTLLVQGVEGHLPIAAGMLGRFRFVPDARLDDLMASYASPDGNVGPHVDSYDVFLVQTSGRRRWRIGRQRDVSFAAGLPLKILADFRPTQEWVLEAGDALYLPPGVAHEGVAVDGPADCITCSVGFRAPAWRELVEPVADQLVATLIDAPRLQGRYADPGAPVTDEPGRLPAQMVDALRRRFASLGLRRDLAVRVLLAHLSEPKPQVVFDRPRRPLPPSAFVARARARGVVADLRTRCLHADRWFGINGEVLPLAPKAAKWLRRFADRRALPPADVNALLRADGQAEGSTATLLHEWYVAGWIHPVVE
jgi:50S ribosomal protein L16 3-hydroxylase